MNLTHFALTEYPQAVASWLTTEFT